MKLILFLIVVMFKCSRSAPTDSNSNKNNSDDWPSQTAGQSLSNVAYVSDADELGNPGVVLQFHRSIKSDNTDIEARQRSALDRSGRGFMRFGRTPNTLRFGRRSSSSPDIVQYRNDENEIEPFSLKMRRSNMMRFGRSRGFSDPNDIFQDDDYNNDASEVYDFIEPPVGRSSDGKYDEHGKKILRLGRSSSELTSDENFDFDRYMSKKSRGDKNLMRFGRGNMMRFGRGNMMRFGRSEKNIVRFGKRSGGQRKLTSSAKIYCEDDNCLIQEKENQLLNNDDNHNNNNNNNYNNDEDELKKDQLNSLFGEDTKQQGYGEYVLTK